MKIKVQFHKFSLKRLLIQNDTQQNIVLISICNFRTNIFFDRALMIETAIFRLTAIKNLKSYIPSSSLGPSTSASLTVYSCDTPLTGQKLLQKFCAFSWDSINSSTFYYRLLPYSSQVARP